MKVFVFGAGEAIGEHVLKKLARTGYEAVTITGTENRAEELERMGASRVMVTRDYDFVEAIDGCDAIIYLAEASVMSGENQNILVDHKAIIGTVEKAQELGVNRIVYLSAVMADESDESKETGAKHEPEELIRQEGVIYTIIRTTHTESKPGKNKVKAARQISRPGGTLANEDVAAVLVEALETEEVYRKTIEITAGDTPIPEALASFG
ncbi:NAD(P)H-binding protein [Indiicoccus explosivorum]|uniref:NAD(P)H-binding protein n=1 Tax=Indiicoccus explosivorum TaxID=1917864 RepID=UPI000B45043F|nr:NAD(P)H-binding protein [Indiicoccus explosivorum]